MHDIFFVYFRTRETRPRRSVQFILLGEPFGVRKWNDTPRSDSRIGNVRHIGVFLRLELFLPATPIWIKRTAKDAISDYLRWCYTDTR
jgi:hypothetical protein